MALERELETYRLNLSNLLAHEGRFVLIQGDKVDSTWETLHEALKAGYERFGVTPFLVKQIAEVEKPLFSSRGVRECRS